MAPPFLDTNIFLRYLLNDHPDHSPRAKALVEQIERGELEAQVAEIVVFETVFTLDRTHRIPKPRIRDSLLTLLALPGLILPGKRRFDRIFEIYVGQNLPFGDAYIAAEMERNGATQIVSFDREFERLPGIERIEPNTSGNIGGDASLPER